MRQDVVAQSSKTTVCGRPRKVNLHLRVAPARTCGWGTDVAFKKKHGKSTQRFVMLPHYMLKAPAFTTLPGEAVKILIDVWSRHSGVNNGEISYSVREAEELGISKSTAARMFDVLDERGFLAKVRNSGFSVKIKMARTWRITAEPRGEERATKDFMRWSPQAASERSKEEAKFKTRSHQRDRATPKQAPLGPTSGTLIVYQGVMLGRTSTALASSSTANPFGRPRRSRSLSCQPGSWLLRRGRRLTKRHEEIAAELRGVAACRAPTPNLGFALQW